MSISQMTKVFKDKTLTPTRKLIMLSIADNANDTGVAFPSWNTIVDRTNLSRQAVQENLKWLSNNGYLFKKNRSRKKGGRSSNKYLIYPHENREFLDEEDYLLFEDLYTQSQSDVPCTQSQSGLLGSGTQSQSGLLESEPSLKELNRHLPLYPQKVQEWLDYKKARKEKLVQATIDRIVKQHNEDPYLFAEKVDHSISNGYQGLFAPKNKSFINSREPQVGSLEWERQQMLKRENNTTDIEVIEWNRHTDYQTYLD